MIHHNIKKTAILLASALLASGCAGHSGSMKTDMALSSITATEGGSAVIKRIQHSSDDSAYSSLIRDLNDDFQKKILVKKISFDESVNKINSDFTLYSRKPITDYDDTISSLTTAIEKTKASIEAVKLENADGTLKDSKTTTTDSPSILSNEEHKQISGNSPTEEMPLVDSNDQSDNRQDRIDNLSDELDRLTSELALTVNKKNLAKKVQILSLEKIKIKKLAATKFSYDETTSDEKAKYEKKISIIKGISEKESELLPDIKNLQQKIAAQEEQLNQSDYSGSDDLIY
ncbi:hypothetical protein [Photobacterium kishitanii]|uniref:Chromosome partitioning protein ParA n=1 Tax=Photobacterium kishitanii TaxID=318456 RepID=A0A2T3KMW2_9GAMM|nr:hypothetical protein [Photobacterium kishitanii]PSV01131.1 hypothetical protein C9J27_03670 [Photobacterium kishitanii]